MILPPATIGVLGGGQLGRYLTLAAQEMGYRVWVLDPDPHSPAGQVADRHLCTPYEDPVALAVLAEHAAVVTCEFENVPLAAAQTLEQQVPLRPSAAALAVAQDRIQEKKFLAAKGIPLAPWGPVHTSEDLFVLESRHYPGYLKTARLGYDGKGQFPVVSRVEALDTWEKMDRLPCVMEAHVPLQREISVILARDPDGNTVVFPAAENEHRDGILFLSRVPARISPELLTQAESLAIRIAKALDYCGILSVEFFVTVDGVLLVNEIAPRTHNSGHYTLEATPISQFQQQVRAICGLRLAPTERLLPAVMLNLLGDLYPDTDQWPDFSAVLERPRARLHLYHKSEARKGRKMGHVTLLGAPTDRDTNGLARSACDLWKALGHTRTSTS